MADAESDVGGNDLFKKEFKYFKSKKPPPDLSSVIDFEYVEKFPEIVKFGRESRRFLGETEIEVTGNCSVCDKLGLESHERWKVFGLSSVPGLTVIINPFSAKGQNNWIEKCLLEYPQIPNVTNIGEITCTSLEYLSKLRWTTLGYHHNWDTKIYTTEMQSPFPTPLSNLTRHICSNFGKSDFHPQSAIINYYQLNSTLSGHVDYSEQDLTSPIVSVSFGQRAVFLIGGKSKSVKPIALFVKSGDVVIMSGFSRLCYHGVPRILQMNDEERWTKDGSSEWLIYYMRHSRINMNVRQVFSNVQQVDSM